MNITTYTKKDIAKKLGNKLGLSTRKSLVYTKEVFNLDIFPNPTSDIVNIRLKSDKSQTYTVNIYNSMGESVKQESIFSARELNKSISLFNYANGVYLVKVIDGNGNFYNQHIVLNR